MKLSHSSGSRKQLFMWWCGLFKRYVCSGDKNHLLHTNNKHSREPPTTLNCMALLSCMYLHGIRWFFCIRFFMTQHYFEHIPMCSNNRVAIFYFLHVLNMFLSTHIQYDVWFFLFFFFCFLFRKRNTGIVLAAVSGLGRPTAAGSFNTFSCKALGQSCLMHIYLVFDRFDMRIHCVIWKF